MLFFEAPPILPSHFAHFENSSALIVSAQSPKLPLQKNTLIKNQILPKNKTSNLPAISADQLLSTFLDLVHIPSPSGQEEKVRQWVEVRLNHLGLAHDYTVDSGGNLLLKIPSNTHTQKTILITAHMDVVPPCLNINPIVEGQGDQRIIRTSGETVLGGDDKAALTSLLAALELSVKHHLPRPNLIIPITVREEIGGLGAFEMGPAQFKPVDLAIALDSNEPLERVVYAAPQLTLFDITVHGHSAHSGFEPEKGANALQALAIAISKFKLGRIDSGTTANIGNFHSGKKFNIVPDLATAQGEVRAFTAERVDSEIANMKTALNQAVQQVPGTHYEWKQNNLIQGYETNIHQPLFDPLKQAFQDLGLSLTPVKTNGGSDVNVFAQWGIPSIVLSGAYHNPHQGNEYVQLQDMVMLTKLLLKIMQRYAETQS